MTYGVSKRDRLARRGDKRWRSTWHRQMLLLNRTRPIDKLDGVSLYDMAKTKRDYATTVRTIRQLSKSLSDRSDDTNNGD